MCWMTKWAGVLGAFKQIRRYCIIDKMAGSGELEPQIRLYLHFCRTEKGLSSNTLQSYGRDLQRFNAWMKNGEAQSVSISDLRQYLDQLRAEGLGNRSIARHVTTLRQFFGFLQDEDLIVSDPTELLTAPKTASRLPKYLERAKLDRVLAAPAENSAKGARDRAMLDLLYATGMRVSEVIALRLSDLNETEGVVRVIGKGNKQRLIPVGRTALASLARYMEGPRAGLLKGRVSAFLFVTARGTAMTRQGFWKLLRSHGRAVGVF